MNDLKKLYRTHKLWFWLVPGLYFAWKLRGLFSAAGSIGDAVAGAAAGATAGVRSSAKDATDRERIKTVLPGATPAQLETFRQDARTIAAALGKLPGNYSNAFIPERTVAMNVCKRYSRLLYRTVAGVPTVARDSRRRPIARKKGLQLTVLVPFYDEVTDGRSLITDLDTEFRKGYNNPFTSFWDTIVKP